MKRGYAEIVQRFWPAISGHRPVAPEVPASPAQRYLAFALPCLALLIKSYVTDVRITDWPLEVSGYPALRDFANLWSGGIAALSGQFASLFDNARHAGELARMLAIPPPHLVWSYPPTAMLALMPMALLPYAVACVVWTAAGAVAYALVAGASGQEPRTSLPLIAAMVLSPGVFLCLAYGQTALLTSAALVAGLRNAERRPLIASLCLALLAAKPQIALVVPVALVAMRCWRTLFGTALIATVYVVLTIVVLGFEPWRLFFGITLPQQVAILNAPAYDPAMMLSPYFLFRSLGLPLSVSYGLQIAVTLAVMAWLLLTLRREKDRNIQVLMVTCAVLLASPYMQTYELPVMILAVAVICGDEKSSARLGGTWLNATIACATVVPFVVLTLMTWSGVNFAALIPFALLTALGSRSLTLNQANEAAVPSAARDRLYQPG